MLPPPTVDQLRRQTQVRLVQEFDVRGEQHCECRLHHTDSSHRSTVKPNRNHTRQVFDIEYGSGSCTGYLSEDTLSWGGIDLEGQTFSQITDASGMGVAFGELLNVAGVDP